MKKSTKTLLATTIVGGLGAIIHNVKTLKHNMTSNTHKYNSTILNEHVKHLKSKQQSRVSYVYHLIFPYNINDYEYQNAVHEYLMVLKYASHRYQVHSNDMARMLHLPLKRAENLTIALSWQHILEHTDMATIGTSRDAKGANFCRQKIAKKDIAFIKSHMISGMVHRQEFTKAFRGVIAYHLM